MHLLATPWQTRVVIPEPSADASQASSRSARRHRRAVDSRHRAPDRRRRARPRRRLDHRHQQRHRSPGRAGRRSRAANLADRIRAWIAAGSVGERPRAGIPEPPAAPAAELAGARAARLALAAEVDAATAEHARAVKAVDHNRRMILAAEGQRLAAQIDEALALVTDLRTEILAVLNTRIAGTSVYHGSARRSADQRAKAGEGGPRRRRRLGRLRSPGWRTMPMLRFERRNPAVRSFGEVAEPPVPRWFDSMAGAGQFGGCPDPKNCRKPAGPHSSAGGGQPTSTAGGGGRRRAAGGAREHHRQLGVAFIGGAQQIPVAPAMGRRPDRVS